MKRTLVSLFVSLIGTAIALGVVEGVYRLSLRRAAPKWSDRPFFYVKAPGAATFQDRRYEVPKPTDLYRVAVIGDSFSFAPYMQYTDTFAKKLEELLRASGAGRPVEVINYGVPAYSTSHEVAVADKAIADGADLILLQITLNDPELKAHRPTGIRENMPDRFASFVPQGTMGSVCTYWKSFCWVLERLHNTKTRQAYIDYFTDLHMNPRTWDPFARSMTELVTRARKANVPLAAVVFPLFGLPMDDTYPFSPVHERVGGLLASLDVPHSDISGIYKSIPLERLQVIPGVDRHPNEIAHRMAAEYLYLWLTHLRLIPEDLTIKELYSSRLGTIDQPKLERPPRLDW